MVSFEFIDACLSSELWSDCDGEDRLVDVQGSESFLMYGPEDSLLLTFDPGYRCADVIVRDFDVAATGIDTSYILDQARQGNEAARRAMRAIVIEAAFGRQDQMVIDVKEFTRAFGRKIQVVPKFPEDTDLLRDLVTEEYKELIQALDERDMPETAKELVDLLYVTLGLAVQIGVPLEEVWDAVHESNMQKLGGPVREDGKILKPDGWQKPDIESIIERYDG